MATQTAKSMRACGQIDGGTEYSVIVPEASTQTFTYGALVYLVSGLATKMADDGQVCFGQAKEAASQSATTVPNIEVMVVTPMTLFHGSVYHATPASAITAITDVGENFALEVVTNAFYIDISNTTNTFWRVLQIDINVPVADVNGYEIAKVQSDYCQMDTAG